MNEMAIVANLTILKLDVKNNIITVDKINKPKAVLSPVKKIKQSIKMNNKKTNIIIFLFFE
tara:strand:+ start:658 stop:840 length:183 start_codon:yes stop_codon:yes gene_type:complete